ncbi:SPOR domain-containing protein [Roseobacter cerasinus]|nr:SPOR domain-containing protein [Roseobacter cerasinus]
MADIQFSHGMGAYGREPEAEDDAFNSGGMVMMTNVAGAVVSLALIAGIGVWGYQLMVRDVSGIPVVRAAEGEMRVRPDDPGGQLARNQGLSVNAVAADGAASGPVDQVVLAPRDMDLADEDQPIRADAVESVRQPQPLAPAEEIIAGAKPVAARVQPVVADAAQAGAIDAVVAELTAGITPLDTPEGELAAQDVSDEGETPASDQWVKRPRLRPGARVQQAAFVSTAPSAEVEAAAIPSGTRLVQLGAFDSADVARSEWGRLQGRFGEYMQNKSRVVQQTDSGGRSFYRLRAMGFVDLADARRFCSALKAEGADCIPVAAK